MNVLKGIGVHGGAPVTVRLHPFEGPITFRSRGTSIPADLSHVVATPRCIVLGSSGVRVAMVEHLLAALTATGFWSQVLIEVEGPELPILDGSAAPWLEPIASLGPAPPTPAPLRLVRGVRLNAAGSSLAAQPGGPALEVRVHFQHPSIGAQAWTGGPDRYLELLGARTFATAEELAELQADGLARGAAPGRGIVFTAQGPAPALRWADEPVRHKALDAVGDLALLGRPLAARLRIDRGSHAAHVAFMQHLRSLPRAITADPPVDEASPT